MRNFTLLIDHHDRCLIFTVETVYNDFLRETYYCVTLNEHAQFIVAWDEEKGSLAIQGPAPYIAKEVESMLTASILYETLGGEID